MGIADELLVFVKESLARGMARGEIEKVLLEAGWPADQVRSALGTYAEVEFPIPVPRPRPYHSAREAFLYLILFSTLYISAFNLGSLLFQFIDLGFPDPAAPEWAAEAAREAIRWSISYLVVAFPVFLFMARLTGRETRQDPGRRGSKTRRWLTYLTLFMAAGVLIGDITGLVYNLLGGELTVRFVLKVLTIAVIAGAIFSYYLRDLRREEREARA